MAHGRLQARVTVPMGILFDCGGKITGGDFLLDSLQDAVNLKLKGVEKYKMAKQFDAEVTVTFFIDTN